MAHISEQHTTTPYARSMHAQTSTFEHMQHLPLATGADTAGQIMVNEIIVHPGDEPPPHTHTREDEAFFILEGVMTFIVGPQSISASPGTFVWLPRYIQHSFAAETEQVAALVHILPANLERYFMQMAQLFQTEQITRKPYPSSFYEKWQALSQQFGITLAPQETPLD